MKPRRTSMLVGALIVASPTLAAEVTPTGLANPEPGNWLMNHRTYDAQRYSLLDKISAGNVKSLKLAYAVALGGTATMKICKRPRSGRMVFCT